MSLVSASRRLPRRTSRRQTGSMAIEMILVVVVLTLATIGIVQFGAFFANAQQVALAARVGAIEASQTAHLPISAGDGVPEAVVSAIEHQLASSQIAWHSVRLEHNLHPLGQPVVLESTPNSVPSDAIPSTLDSAPPGPYVRVTVEVPLVEVFPSRLSLFGYPLLEPGKTYQHSALFRYELDTP